MVKYVFKEVVPIRHAKDADPQVIGEALQKIKDDNGGDLKPQYVWQAAKSTKHPLHAYFEWNVEAAAQAFWSEQARTLIQCIKIVGDDDKPPAPAFISINEAGTGTSYRTLREVMDSSTLQLIALKNAERELESFEKRFRMFEDICSLIRAARRVAAKRRAKHESRASLSA